MNINIHMHIYMLVYIIPFGWASRIRRLHIYRSVRPLPMSFLDMSLSLQILKLQDSSLPRVHLMSVEVIKW